MSSAPLGWYAWTYSPRIASVRLRCLAPMRALRQAAVMVEPYRSHRRGYGAVVFSKVYDARAIAAAQALKANGGRVILDLCDNHFFGEEVDPSARARSARLEKMISLSDLVISATDALKAQLAARFPQVSHRLLVIPDYLEDQMAPRMSAMDHLALRSLDRFIEHHPESLRLIWFGNHGAAHTPAGMVDLLNIRSRVEAQAASTPLTLTVMSNSRAKYRHLVSGWRVPTTYVPWSVGRAQAVLQRHHVAVLPISPNPFTLAKTVNRPATAILAGLGVIADAIPSYEELRPFICLDDWAQGLKHYAATRPHSDPRLEAARAHLAFTYRPDKITALWRTALQPC